MSSSMVLECPLCSHRFPHSVLTGDPEPTAFGFGLDFRLVPRDSNLSSETAMCPSCRFASLPHDFNRRVPGHVRELVRSTDYINIFKQLPEEELPASRWIALISVLDARGINPRDLGVMSVKGSWVARELCCPCVEKQLLEAADCYFDEALRRGLTKGEPAMVMYLLGEVNRRKGDFDRGREMLTFLGNNPRFRYPALLLTVLIEEQDSTPYWSLHAPDAMEHHSPAFKGLFPPLRSIPPGKVRFSPDELAEPARESDEDDGQPY
ncbi:DUF2225 domain-containing protein [Thermodesulfobacteriota bacterium]